MSKKEELLKIGFLTGSQFYGTATEDSDIDIAISIGMKRQALKIIGDSKITDSEYNGGCYFDENGEKINCIFLHPNELDGWIFATITMKTMLNIAEIEKIDKCDLFQILVSSFKMSNIKIKEVTCQQNMKR
jgi:hypothetical protein